MSSGKIQDSLAGEEQGVTGPSGIQSVEIGLQILATLGRMGGVQQLSVVARACDMPRSKAYRYLVSLERSGFVDREPATGRYMLGSECLRVGLSALGNVDFVKIASNQLSAICQDLHESVLLSVWSERGPTIVRWEDAGRQIAVNVRVGSTMPMLTSATGQIFSAFLPEVITRELIEDEINSGTASQWGIKNWTDAGALLDDVRRTGLGRALGRMLPSIEAFSAPVFDQQGRLAGALTCLGLKDTFDASIEGRLALTLKAKADQISARLGYNGTLSQ